MDALAPPERIRRDDLARGLALESVTVAWNIGEFVIGLLSGLATGSVVLLAYGIDALIETTSSAIVAFRLGAELRGRSGAPLDRTEARATRATALLLLALAALVSIESSRVLFGAGPAPRESRIGIALTATSALAMPFLGALKLRLARRLGSSSLRIEALQTIACAWFSLTTLLGLVLNGLLGWWWADPLSALLLVPWMLREGLGPWRESSPHA